MKTKKWKRALSAVLAGTMLVTSLSAALTAWAAEEDTAVTDVEAKIQSYYSTHRNNLYGEDGEAKDAARAAFNDVSDSVKKLSEDQKLEVTMSNYAYWIYTVTEDEYREAHPDVTRLSTPERVQGTIELMDAVEETMGDLPASYQKVYDTYKTALATPAYTVANEGGEETVYYIPDKDKVVYKDNETAQNLLNTLTTTFGTFTEQEMKFAGYVYPNTSGSGFYFYASSPTTDRALKHAFADLFKWNFYMQQDLIGNGSILSFSYRNFVVRSGDRDNYTYAWAEGKGPQDYLDAFDAAVASYGVDQCQSAVVAGRALLTQLDQTGRYPGLLDAYEKVVAVAQPAYDGTAELEQVKEAIAAVDGLTGLSLELWNYIRSSVSDLKVAYTITNPYTLETITPELAYTRASSINGRNLYYCYNQLSDVVTELEMQDFIADVRAADPAALTDAEIEEFRSRYMALGDDFQEQLPADVAAKFMEMIKPAIGDDQFEDDLLAFTPAAVDKTEISGDTIQLVGGVQNVSENLWSTAVSLLDVLKVFGVDLGVDLSNGLEPIVANALYTDSVVEAIFDLYATLSHDTTDMGILGLTLGDIIEMVISPSGVAGKLEEAKFAGAVEKINAITDLTDEEEAQGMTELDKLGAIDFTDADLGFTNGDRDGFIDALLAALRPITSLLTPDARVIIISLGVQMCDYINAEGQYVTGVYGNLIPLFEQLGMNVPSAEEYAANYNAVLEAKGETVATDEYLRPIIESLFEDVVDPILADPVNALVDLLPRLAYIIDGDRLNSYLKPAIAQMGGTLGGALGGLDLGTAAINGMIPDSFTIPVNDTTNITLNIGDINWARLADCATLSVVPSVSNANAYTLLRTGEPETVFTEIFYLLYTALFGDPDVDMTQYNNTMAALKAVINNDALWMFVDAIGENTIVKGKEYAYGQILDLFSTIDFTDCKVAANVIVNGAGEVLQAGQQMNGSFTAVKGVNLAYIVRATAEDTVIDTLTVNGVAVPEAAGKAYYLLNAAAAKGQVIEVTFRSSTQYTVTAQAGINGNVTPANQTVFSCQTASVTATADPNCLIESFTVNGVEVPEAVDKVSYTWTGVVTADTQIVVKFAVKEPATPILTDVTITRDGTPIDGNVTYVTVPWYKLWTTGNVTLGYTVNEGVEVASVKWDYANWSVEDPQATIGSTDTDTTVIRAKNGIGPRSCWIQVTVTDTNGVSVTSDPVKVRFINFDWQK